MVTAIFHGLRLQHALVCLEGSDVMMMSGAVRLPVDGMRLF